MAVGTRTHVQQTSLKCCECGNVVVIWRKRSKMKKKGHGKHMECLGQCNKVTLHNELRFDNEIPSWIEEWQSSWQRN